MLKGTLLLCLLTITSTANAELYKCTNANGDIEFKDKPCAVSQSTEWAKETEQEKRDRKLKAERDERAKRAADEYMAKMEREKLWHPIEQPPEHIKSAILSYLDLVLKDPDSIKDIQWTKSEADGNGYRVNLFFRAKNSWGAYGISQHVFITNLDGKILDTKEIK